MLNLCRNHKQESNQSEFAEIDCAYCKSQQKIEKLKGWLKYLYYYYLDGSADRLEEEEQSEISDYINTMEE